MPCQSSVWNHPPTRPANVLFPSPGEEEEGDGCVGAKSGGTLERHVRDTTLEEAVRNMITYDSRQNVAHVRLNLLMLLRG